MTTPQRLPDRRLPSSRIEPVGLAPSMIDAISRAHAFAPAATPIIVYGESGTGKTFFAEFIHDLSQRLGGFHPFSVGTVAPQLALDELFGHVQGAYTDARKMRTGRIATAGAGTLLLDDVQNLDLGVQKQLLQVLDRGSYSPVGSDRVLTVACRIILAMTEDPDVLMGKGLLLKDLRYRLGACVIRIPPLRERRSEIPLLVQRALAHCADETRVDGPQRISESALELLRNAEYDGNVRELRAIVQYAYLMARAEGTSEIAPNHVPGKTASISPYRRRGDREANRIAVARCLTITGGNVKAAAQLLGVSRNSLNAFLAKERASDRLGA